MRCKYAQCSGRFTLRRSQCCVVRMLKRLECWVNILAGRICRAVGIAPAIGRSMSYLLSPVIEH